MTTGSSLAHVRVACVRAHSRVCLWTTINQPAVCRLADHFKHGDMVPRGQLVAAQRVFGGDWLLVNGICFLPTRFDGVPLFAIVDDDRVVQEVRCLLFRDGRSKKVSD